MSEHGWSPLYDEGARLLATTNTWTGIQAILTLPRNFGAPKPESYFNFYLGINEFTGKSSGGIKIEAGISYGENLSGKTNGWAAFLNNHGKHTRQPITLTPGATISISLRLNGNYALLSVPNLYLGDRTTIRRGAPKMCIALHEQHKALKDRKAWFDNVQLQFDGIWEERAYKTPSQVKVGFDAARLDRKLFNSDFGANYLLTKMNQP